jgi:capsular polysaccharide biosynthesis protein
MPDWVFVFDSSYPSVDVALPIDDERFHIFVSVRKIEPPPGHGDLKLEDEVDLRTVRRNLAAVRAARPGPGEVECIVIASPIMRPEQLALNAGYALSLSRDVWFFDGLHFHPMHRFLRRLLKAALAGFARTLMGGIKLRLKTVLFNRRVRRLLGYRTPEGCLFGVYTSARSFSLAPDTVALREDGRCIYGESTRGWYLPAFSGRRQRYRVRTTRQHLQDVTLHVEDIHGGEVSSLFQNGLILDYPYMLGRGRSSLSYPASSHSGAKTIERGICLLAYTSGYYHWLLEGVPRILDVIDEGFDFDRYPLILPPLAPFQRQLLELLGLDPQRQVITVGKGEWCHVKDCIFPTAYFPFGSPELEDPSGQPDRELLLRIRDRVMERFDPPQSGSTPTPRRIYISRAKAAKRKFAPESEAALRSTLERAGFEAVCLEDLPWSAQVQIVANAEFIAGMHGAGLTNVLFTKAHSLLEFHNPLETRAYFAVVARELDISYGYVIGGLKGNSPSFDNVTIDLASVERMLLQLESRRGG